MKDFLINNPAIAGVTSFIGVMFSILTGVVLVKVLTIGVAITLKPVLALVALVSISVLLTCLPLMFYMEELKHYKGMYRAAMEIAFQRNREIPQSDHWVSSSDDDLDDDLDGDGRGDDSLRRLGLIQ